MRVLLVAGGSGGHLIPALALADHLRSNGSCAMLSTARAVDRTLAQAQSAQLDWITVDMKQITPLTQWISPSYVWRQCAAMRQVGAVIQQVKPEVVVGFGGYLSAVGVVAARMARIPAVVHEQNVVPGRANQWLARWVHAVAISFPETRNYLPPRTRVEVTGNPIRISQKIVTPQEARAFFQLDAIRPVVLVMGGSQGAQAINQTVLAMWEGRSVEDRRQVQVIHLAGAGAAAAVEESYRHLQMEARVFEFLHEMEYAYRAANLAISRAGATTLTELAAWQLPAILIPYPYAGAHQQANALWLARQGQASVVEQKELTPGRLWQEMTRWLAKSSPAGPVPQPPPQTTAAAERLAALLRKVASA